MKLPFTLAAATGLLLSAFAAPVFAQSSGSGSCETHSATNPAAFAQLCAGPREFPEWADPVMGEGDGGEAGDPCSVGYLPADARWGERVLVATLC